MMEEVYIKSENIKNEPEDDTEHTVSDIRPPHNIKHEQEINVDSENQLYSQSYNHNLNTGQQSAGPYLRKSESTEKLETLNADPENFPTLNVKPENFPRPIDNTNTYSDHNLSTENFSQKTENCLKQNYTDTYLTQKGFVEANFRQIQTGIPHNLNDSQSANIPEKVYENGKINRPMCVECGKSFKNRSNLKNHIKFVHAEDQTVECKECMRSFKSILYLRSHMSSVHAKTEVVYCPHCNKAFLNKKKLSNHIYYTHREPEEQVTCKVCSKTFKGPYNLKIHMRYVHPAGEPHPCPFCYKTFKVEMLLQRHLKWAHPGDGMTYKCQECHKILPSLDGFKTHMKNVHLFDRATCDLCKRTFKTKKSLERHLKNIHNGKPPEKIEEYVPKEHTCQFCERSFNNSTSLFWHIERFHAQLQKLPNDLCIICNKEFSDYAALHRHLTSVHSLETATCKICQKEFKSPINLQNHIRITHAPPEATQKCDICQKTFKCPLHLRMHVLAVHDGGEYPCDICQKTFTSTKYLNKHKKSHSDIRDFQCDICLKMYKNINAVNKHKKLVHNGVKCTICNIKQPNIEDHMRKCHPDVAINLTIDTAKPSKPESVKRKRRTVDPNKRKKKMDDAKNIESEHNNANMHSIENMNASMHSEENINAFMHFAENENAFMHFAQNMNTMHSSEDNNINTDNFNETGCKLNDLSVVKSEIQIDEIVCRVCEKKIDSSEYDEHAASCERPPILEVTIKMEVDND